MKKTVDPLLSHTRAFVNLNTLSHNLREIRKKVGSQSEIMAVVKANAYGHGAVEVARRLIEEGVSFFAVARIREAATLREHGIQTPILLFGAMEPDQAVYAARNHIRISVSSLDAARKLNRELAHGKIPARVHVKIDTGMGRLGLLPDYNYLETQEDTLMVSAVEAVMDMAELEYIDVEGLYTHFACADEFDKRHVNAQLSLFRKVVAGVKERGFSLKIVHAANSAALIDMAPSTYFDMVRPGIALYGQYPSFEVDHDTISLRPVMEIRSKIIQLKKVPKGICISYGCTHVTEGPALIATIPIGYADGYSRLLSSRGRMLVRGFSAPIVGRVCMDLTMIDVTHVPDVAEGDEVVILGSQGKEEITADEIADLTGTISYEVLSSLTGRIPIAYKG